MIGIKIRAILRAFPEAFPTKRKYLHQSIRHSKIISTTSPENLLPPADNSGPPHALPAAASRRLSSVASRRALGRGATDVRSAHTRATNPSHHLSCFGFLGERRNINLSTCCLREYFTQDRRIVKLSNKATPIFLPQGHQY